MKSSVAGVMDIRHITTFEAIVSEGSFVGAAQKLGYSQSTITMQVQALERELATELFERGEKRITLTEGGRLLREHAGRILDDMRAMRQAMCDLTNGETGLVRIAAIEPAAARLTVILARFLREHPKVKVALESGGSCAVSERVEGKAVDIGICSTPPSRLGLTFEPLYVEDQLALLPADHELASKPRIRAKDIACCNRIILTEPGCNYRETTERGFMQSGLLIAAAMEISNPAVLKRAVQTGIGIAILPEHVASPPPEGTVLRSLEGVKIGLPVGLVRRPDGGPPSRLLRTLIDDIRELLLA
ncbi:MAG: LysR family transcriptional regulator [Candidatus Eremiobacteraeota bacterium]|nr:LysR family transcriptional regulator [Candidatus Eremiobacteraeota bacterium]MBV8280484.1 LysR family transcriptional regulator [Candidatus Eremiobacteraeota bacterium]